MTSPSRSPGIRAGIHLVSALIIRVILGGSFLYLGATKALHPVELLKLLRQYDALHHFVLLNFVASTLPWLEILCGLFLVLGVAVRGSAVVLCVMLGVFTTAVLIRAQAIHASAGLPFCAITFDCGCGAGEVNACRKLGQNLILMAFSVTLVFQRTDRLCLRHTVF